jgi:hypothetical protein
MVLSSRGGDEILSSSPQEAAHLIAKPQARHLPGEQAMESRGTRSIKICLTARR